MDRALDVYLNDHLGGSMLGSNLAEQIRDRADDSELRDEMTAIAREIGADVEALQSLMDALDVSRNPVKQATGWLAEKASQVKFSGAGSGEPDQGMLMAIESLRLGVAGKRCLWLALTRVREAHDPLRTVDLEELIARAESQEERLERLRIDVAASVLS